MSPYEQRYWWRAQATAYLLRLNNKTVAWLGSLRGNRSSWQLSGHPEARDGGGYGGGPRRRIAAGTIPLPAGAISMHIREGDKWKESGNELAHFPTYWAQARAAQSENPLGVARIVFLSGENPDNVAALLNASRQTPGGWLGAVSVLPRQNSNGYQQALKFGVEQMTAQWLLQLTIALECDVFVGARLSNWNRLIDELRCTWVPKCRYPFYEVGGPYPPLREGERLEDYADGPLGWR